MVKADFARWLRQTLAYFERKSPPDTTVDLWYEAVKDLPDEVLAYASQSLTELEGFPRNLPGYLHAKSREWYAANPHRQPTGQCECRRGVWEVASWRPELREWAIYTIPCTCSTGAPRNRFDLLSSRLYDREPDRYQETLPPWALVYPDQDSLAHMRAAISAQLASRRQTTTPTGVVSDIEDLPF